MLASSKLDGNVEKKLQVEVSSVLEEELEAVILIQVIKNPEKNDFLVASNV